MNDDDLDVSRRQGAAGLIAALAGTTFNWVDTIANLRTIAHVTTSPITVLQGYAAPGDGGGGIFWWDAASTAADNDGTIIRPNNVTPPSAAGRWKRLYSGAVNARWFGAGLGLGLDSDRIDRALALLTFGGELFFPVGYYYTTRSIVIPANYIVLRGESPTTSVLSPVSGGNFDTIRIGGSTPSSGLTGIQVHNFWFAESGKTGGNALLIQYCFQVLVSNCFIYSPSAGVRVHGCNTVEFERVRIDAPRAANSWGFWLSGDATTTCHVTTFKNVTVQGAAGTAHSTHGMIVDGAVHTISAYKLYLNQMDGNGLWFRNTMGSIDNPEFITFYGLEIEGPFLHAISVDVGRELYFTDAQLFGSVTRTNVLIGNAARCVTFQGGFSRAAYGSGFDIFGQQVTITGVDVHWNSAGHASVESGIQVSAGSRMVVVSGNKCGDPISPSQFAGIRIFSGADQFSVVGNVCFHNSVGISNAAGTSSSKVVANNAS